MAEIRLENVTRRYGDFTALDDVSLTIEHGTFTSLFGPPGSGKSVLLRILLGLEMPDQGRIYINNKDVTDLGPAERNLAMVFQNLALFPQLTARENILFPMRRRGGVNAEIDQRLDLIASVLSIPHILHKKPGQLSGGERQRVAIARALIRDAEAWMLDEPISALDARMRDAARIELKRLQAEQGRTFIYVTHDCDEAMSVCDNMVILDHGKVAQIGKPDDIYAKPATAAVAELVGAPRINLLDARAKGDFADTPFGAMPLPGMVHGDIRLAIRPEALHLVQSKSSGKGASSQLKAKIADIEKLGGFSILGLVANGTRIRLISNSQNSAAIGDDVSFEVDLSGAHIFDKLTGLRLDRHQPQDGGK
jgi:multiple sugar transport system ATP-binding protein